MGRNEEEAASLFSTVPSDRTRRLKQLEFHLFTTEDIFYCESGQSNVFPFIHRSSPSIPSHMPYCRFNYKTFTQEKNSLHNSSQHSHFMYFLLKDFTLYFLSNCIYETKKSKHNQNWLFWLLDKAAAIFSQEKTETMWVFQLDCDLLSQLNVTVLTTGILSKVRTVDSVSTNKQNNVTWWYNFNISNHH